MKQEKSNFNKTPFVLIILIILAILVGPSAIDQINNPNSEKMTLESIVAKMYGQDENYMVKKTEEVKNKQKNKRKQKLKEQVRTIGEETLGYYVSGLAIIVLGIVLWGRRDVRKAKKIAKGYQCPEAPPEKEKEENDYKKYIEEVVEDFTLETNNVKEDFTTKEKDPTIENTESNKIKEDFTLEKSETNKIEEEIPSSNLEDALKELDIISLEDLKNED